MRDTTQDRLPDGSRWNRGIGHVKWKFGVPIGIGLTSTFDLPVWYSEGGFLVFDGICSQSNNLQYVLHVFQRRDKYIQYPTVPNIPSYTSFPPSNRMTGTSPVDVKRQAHNPVHKRPSTPSTVFPITPSTSKPPYSTCKI
ncbi:hypothetical protein P154DRAFT_531708 [Amniculicola lignicola CBS 123094]|uniref:Uncharacterized protein n=1 Tax=Amniculicola lignicola CBS 123094 TaxID=1392246 RepID=A0A6A5X1F0_9PLEO|nr:hypothetical protein P154DRAFT_531708 [Amniculicola lignicola CBS 123094]